MAKLVKAGAATMPSMPSMPAMHTAGIYSDMTVDGPEIGDLVVIVDKAKNLPNRKTIGKQDPYCAARLGKEAKKTETDRRGGQTPKWDQELRFTVHDSPDYYQLKVSIFNDDKKTDLIGETFINLDAVVVRGGGRSDGWHALNCKGRYAGEIRIELTYYDIRPKEDRRQELRHESPRNTPERDTVGGPRQLNQIKRRPLPQDPTTVSPSSLPHSTPDQTPPSNSHLPPGSHPSPPEGYPSFPEHQRHSISALPAALSTGRSSGQSSHPAIRDDASWTASYRHEAPPPTTMSLTLAPAPAPAGFDGRGSFTSADFDDPFYSYAGPHQGSFNTHQDDPDSVDDPPPPPPAHKWRASDQAAAASSQMQSQSLPHSQSVPSMVLPVQAGRPFDGPGYRHSYIESSDRRRGSDLHRAHAQLALWEGEPGNGAAPRPGDRAPPPPSHRKGHSHVAFSDAMGGGVGGYGAEAVQAPAPLQITHRQREDRSTWHQMQSPPSEGSMPSTTSPPARGSGQRMTVPSRSSPSQYRRRSADSMVSFPDESSHMPPSLIPGYDPAVAAEVSRRNLAEREAGRHQGGHASASGRPTANAFRHSQSHHDLSSLAARSEDLTGRRLQRSSAPMIKPRAVSPHQATAGRQPPSPLSQTVSEAPSLSGMPFSPDAYDAFNPKARSPPGSERGSTRDGPAYDSSRAGGEEPIRGNDGRIIDPSDHLPTDTWAPEPVRKSTQGTPSRSSPHGPSRDRAGRPVSMTTPMYVSHEEGAPTPHTSAPSSLRNRLQKRIRAQASSPALNGSSPLASQGVQQPFSRSPPHSSRTDYALRERENYAAANSPPLQALRQPAARGSSEGPPVPPKVAMKTGREDLSALSQELNNIHIGGRARRTARRVNY